MNPVWDEWKSCTRKHVFDQSEAERRAFWYGMVCYKCRFCEGHHLASKK